jgi:hypothetical protein
MPTIETLEDVDAKEVIALLETGGMAFTPAKRAVVVRIFKDTQPAKYAQPSGCITITNCALLRFICSRRRDDADGRNSAHAANV